MANMYLSTYQLGKNFELIFSSPFPPIFPCQTKTWPAYVINLMRRFYLLRTEHKYSLADPIKIEINRKVGVQIGKFLQSIE